MPEPFVPRPRESPPPTPREAPAEVLALLRRLDRAERELASLRDETEAMRNYVRANVEHLNAGLRKANEKSDAATATFEAAMRVLQTQGNARHTELQHGVKRAHTNIEIIFGMMTMRGALLYLLWFLAAFLFNMLQARR